MARFTPLLRREIDDLITLEQKFLAEYPLQA